MKTQFELQQKCIEAGVVPVTCGNCGAYLLMERGLKECVCPVCFELMDACNIPDLCQTKEEE